MRYDDRIAVIGNVDCSIVLLSERDVAEVVKETIAKAAREEGSSFCPATAYISA